MFVLEHSSKTFFNLALVKCYGLFLYNPFLDTVWMTYVTYILMNSFCLLFLCRTLMKTIISFEVSVFPSTSATLLPMHTFFDLNNEKFMYKSQSFQQYFAAIKDLGTMHIVLIPIMLLPYSRSGINIFDIHIMWYVLCILCLSVSEIFFMILKYFCKSNNHCITIL